MTSFITWLTRQHQRQDPVGDLATDVRQDIKDGCRPPGWSLAAFVEHLEDHGAVDGALDAAERAWKEWRAESP